MEKEAKRESSVVKAVPLRKNTTCGEILDVIFKDGGPFRSLPSLYNRT